MDLKHAVAALGALAQDSRLRVFRLLVQAGSAGLPAGEIARALGVPPNTLSAHLSVLSQAGLVRSRRQGRSILYSADFAGMRALLVFLTEDCCQGRPELCSPSLAVLAADARPPAQPEGSLAMSTKTRPVRPYNVLFLCTGNSARSIMAECALARWSQGRFNAFSAGSHPKGQVHPMTLELLRRMNYETDHLRSKSWDEFTQPGAPPLDFVFTVCDQAAGEMCPVWPGQPMTAHWGVEDPAAFVGPEDKQFQVFKRIYLELENRIKIFASLRLEALDRLTLKARLEAIGRTRPGESESPAAS